PGWSPTGQFTTIFPLAIFVGFAMMKEALEDSRRHQQDKMENFMVGQKLVVSSEGCKKEGGSGAKRSGDEEAEFEELTTSPNKVGDVLYVQQGEVIPADIVVLGSSLPNGLCFIETSNLDGESNLKQKQAISQTADILTSHNSFTNFSAKIQAESPRGDLYNFEGYIALQGGMHTLTLTQMLPRGTTLANTEYIYGVIIYTGEETKIRKNATSSIRTKAPSMEKIINLVVLFMFAFVIFLTGITTLLGILWEQSATISLLDGMKHWYLLSKRTDYMAIFFSNLILYNNLIPLPLYVGMELVKIVQALFVGWDIQLYDPSTDEPAAPRTSALSEELGQVQYVFTDKTGTLTQNVMAFKKMSVGGQSYVHSHGESAMGGVPGQSQSSIPVPTAEDGESLPTWVLARELKAIKPSVDGDVHLSSLDAAQKRKHGFLLAMALCHTVLPDNKATKKTDNLARDRKPSIRVHSLKVQSPNKLFNASHGSVCAPVQGVAVSTEDAAIQYQSSSPDETALVSAARDMSYVLRQRTLHQLTLSVLMSSKEDSYILLQTIEFSSNRKRMS
ncbi:hypothetical protein HDV05_000755, partial [Chytridiales sp. JEL 0842]